MQFICLARNFIAFITMQFILGIKQWFVSEVKALFTLQQTDRLWHIALLAFVCMAVPLSIGLYFNQLTYSIMVCLGGLVILYMPTADWRYRMLVMLLSSFGFVASFAVGLLFSQNDITRIVSISAFAFIVHSICLYFNFKSPGSTFFYITYFGSIVQCAAVYSNLTRTYVSRRWHYLSLLGSLDIQHSHKGKAHSHNYRRETRLPLSSIRRAIGRHICSHIVSIGLCT